MGHPTKLKQAALALLTLLFLLLSVLVVVKIRSEWKSYNFIGQSAEFPHTISISGEGKVTAIPDIATLTIGLMTERSTVAAAQQENTEKMNKIIADLKTQGIEDADIKTTNYNIYPNYDYNPTGRVLRGYHVDQNVTIKIRDLKKVSTILEIAGQSGANNVSGINFTIDDPEAYRQEARLAAITQAREKAEKLAEAAGVTLGKVVSFSESSGGYPEPYPVYARSYADAAVGLGGAAPEIEVGSNEVVVNATVTFEIY